MKLKVEPKPEQKINCFMKKKKYVRKNNLAFMFFFIFYIKYIHKPKYLYDAHKMFFSNLNKDYVSQSNT